MPSEVGFSFLFPAIPIFCGFTIILLALLLPGFLKTRSISLLSLWCWLYVSCLLQCINMILWKGNVDDIFPVYCDIGRRVHLSAFEPYSHLFQWQPSMFLPTSPFPHQYYACAGFFGSFLIHHLCFKCIEM